MMWQGKECIMYEIFFVNLFVIILCPVFAHENLKGETGLECGMGFIRPSTLQGAQGLCSSVENVLFLCVNGALEVASLRFYEEDSRVSILSLPFSSLFFFTSSSVHSPR